jgi:hypothetical protein
MSLAKSTYPSSYASDIHATTAVRSNEKYAASPRISKKIDFLLCNSWGFFCNARVKVDTCMDYTPPSLALSVESIRISFLSARDRGLKLRYITEITTDNISYCKELMKIVEVKHLDGIKGNFMVSEKEYLAPVVSNNTSDIASQIIYSNLHQIVEQQNYIFNTLWNKAIPAITRIREIEEGEPIATRLLEESGFYAN